MILRAYRPRTDRKSVHRIWTEIGWLEEGSEESLDLCLTACRCWVAEIEGEAECLVLTSQGVLRYQREDIPFTSVQGVTTGRIGRRQGLALHLTAKAVAEAAQRGTAVFGLGMFEQGFYDRLGFGTGSYEHTVCFHPFNLKTNLPYRRPKRLSQEDWETIHASRLSRLRWHGSCSLIAPELTRAEMLEHSNGFGLGFFDGGDLSHHLWFRIRGPVEKGAYRVEWMSFRTWRQFLELMAVIQSLGDEVSQVTMLEPAGMQVQSLIRRPFQLRRISRGSRYENRINAAANWQMRICDLPVCLEKTHLPGEPVHFNLTLKDPIEQYLGQDESWRGVGGEYVVTLGPVSRAERGTDTSLPTLSTSVGTFTRWWLGVLPAAVLSAMDELSAPQKLVDALDTYRLPLPHPDWSI
jgi:hypothetical protein